VLWEISGNLNAEARGSEKEAGEIKISEIMKRREAGEARGEEAETSVKKEK